MHIEPLNIENQASAASQGDSIDHRRASRVFWIISGLLVLLALSTVNPWITSLSVAVAAAMVLLLWRTGEPPVLLFAYAIQWLQVSMVVLYADFAGADLSALSGFPELARAVILSLFGLLALAAGTRLALIRSPRDTARNAEHQSRECSVSRLFLFYVAALSVCTGLASLAGRMPQIAQLLIAATATKWVFLFLICYSSLQQRGNYLWLWSAVSIEFSVGLLGYFSGFKNIFFLLIVVILSTYRFWNARRVMLAAVACCCLIVSGIIWSAVKTEYRDFISEGSGQQDVLVPITQRVGKLKELLENLTDEGFFQGFDALVSRVGYVSYFALTVMNVPDRLPYEHGQLWWGAIKHVFTPRLFFPQKAALDDSERTTYYTGVTVAGVEQGTSISIGYMGESYIDFGPVGMLGAIFLVGLFYGSVYRIFVSRARFKVIGYAAATSILLFSTNNFETSNIKLLGGIVTASIVIGICTWLGEATLARAIGIQQSIDVSKS